MEFEGDFGHSSLISTKRFSQDTQHASTDPGVPGLRELHRYQPDA